MTAASEECLPTRYQSSWQWPVDRSNYDCSSTLTNAEHEALVALGWDIRRRCHDDPHPSEWTAIERLVKPLDDARRSMFVKNSRYHRRSALDAVGIILRGCAVTRRPFWVWGPSVWIDQILCESQLDFRKTFNGRLDAIVRPYTMAIAYLLKCNVEFQRLGKFSRRSLANRVFGTSLVDQAIDPIMVTMQDWGYSSGRKTPQHPGLVSARSPIIGDYTIAVM